MSIRFLPVRTVEGFACPYSRGVVEECVANAQSCAEDGMTDPWMQVVLAERPAGHMQAQGWTCLLWVGGSLDIVCNTDPPPAIGKVPAPSVPALSSCWLTLGLECPPFQLCDLSLCHSFLLFQVGTTITLRSNTGTTATALQQLTLATTTQTPTTRICLS